MVTGLLWPVVGSVLGPLEVLIPELPLATVGRSGLWPQCRGFICTTRAVVAVPGPVWPQVQVGLVGIGPLEVRTLSSIRQAVSFRH